jgi:hypothetical protein
MLGTVSYGCCFAALCAWVLGITDNILIQVVRLVEKNYKDSSEKRLCVYILALFFNDRWKFIAL